MAYPFHALPSFAVFKQTLAESYQVEYVEGDKLQVDGAGHPHSIWYFKKEIDGEIQIYSFEIRPDDDLITFSLIRAVCKHFDIDCKKDGLFGLDLG